MLRLLESLRMAQTTQIQPGWILTGGCACQKILRELSSLLQACQWSEQLGRRAAALGRFVPSSSRSGHSRPCCCP